MANPFVHVELNSTDVAKAKAFYSKLFDWKLEDVPMDGGDNYTMFADQKVLVGPEAGPLLITALEHYLAAKRVVAPRVEGRITIVR